MRAPAAASNRPGEFRVLEHRDGDAERLETLADVSYRLDEDRRLQLFDRGAETGFPGQPVGLDLAMRRRGIGSEPGAVITVHLDVADHRGDRPLANIDLGTGHLRDAVLEIGPSEAAMPHFVAH